nr:hypothetical protein [Tanacetum cinerariifolium]
QDGRRQDEEGRARHEACGEEEQEALDHTRGTGMVALHGV